MMNFMCKKIFKARNYFLKSSNNNDEDKLNVKILKYVFIMY